VTIAKEKQNGVTCVRRKGELRVLGIVVVLVLQLLLVPRAGGASDEVWYKIYGGSSGGTVASVDQTSDGGYAFAGTTMSWGAGYSDVWLVKTDSEGNLVWNSTYGTPVYDAGYSVQQTADDGYIITGYCNNKGYGYASHKPWLIKTDAYGYKTWDRIIHGGATPSDSFARANSIQQTPDGGYIVAGYVRGISTSESDVWLIKTDPLGIAVWNKTFGKMYGDDPGDEEAYTVRQTNDGGYVLAAISRSNYDYRGWVMKTDTSGEQQWEVTLETTNMTCTVQQTADGKYMIFGNTPGAWYSGCVRLIKIGENGEWLWDRVIEDLPHSRAADALQVRDGGYVVVSGYGPSTGAANVSLMYVTGLVHNLAVNDVLVSKTVVGQGYPAEVSFTVANQGNYTESFNVTVYANETIVAKHAFVLENCSSTSLTITWNTTSFALGDYIVKAVVDRLPIETNRSDNAFTDGIVHVAVPGDVDGNHWVNMLDLYLIALNFGKSAPYPAPQIANYDIDNNGIINMLDLYIAAIHFGQTDP
jgi:hypothetical protein